MFIQKIDLDSSKHWQTSLNIREMTDTISPWQWMDQGITTEYVIATTGESKDLSATFSKAYGSA